VRLRPLSFRPLGAVPAAGLIGHIGKYWCLGQYHLGSMAHLWSW